MLPTATAGQCGPVFTCLPDCLPARLPALLAAPACRCTGRTLATFTALRSGMRRPRHWLLTPTPTQTGAPARRRTAPAPAPARPQKTSGCLGQKRVARQMRLRRFWVERKARVARRARGARGERGRRRMMGAGTARCCPGGCRQSASRQQCQVRARHAASSAGQSQCTCGALLGLLAAGCPRAGGLPAGAPSPPHCARPSPRAPCLGLPPAAEFGSTAVISGKSCCLMRKRVLTQTLAGRPIWASAGQYAVTLTVAGPPPPGWVRSGLG